jgi:hypothetical protein
MMDKFNNTMQTLTDLFNGYVGSINQLDRIRINSEIGLINPLFNLKPVTYTPVVLKSYDIQLTQELIDFLNSLKQRTIDLYRNIISIQSMIPTVDTVDAIESKI